MLHPGDSLNSRWRNMYFCCKHEFSIVVQKTTYLGLRFTTQLHVHTYDIIIYFATLCSGASFRGLRGWRGLYRVPPRIYDFSFFPVNRTFETVLLLQKQYIT